MEPPPGKSRDAAVPSQSGFLVAAVTKRDIPARPVADAPAFPVHVDRAHEVEVRGHRLLLQPDGFEGLGLVAMDLDVHDQPVANRELLGEARFDRNTASTSGGDGPNEHKNPLPVNFEVALRLEAC